MQRLFLVCSLLFLFSVDSAAQLSYQISNYGMQEYGAGNQNWDISGDGEQRVFVANNHGLLVLKNAEVKLYTQNESTIFRSVEFINNRIYTGSFEDFGYWEENEAGELTYFSLAKDLSDEVLNNDEIWSIVEKDGNIYFHSFGSIYCYNGETTTRLEKNGSFMFLHKIGDEVYTQAINGGLFWLKNGALQAIPNSGFLTDEEVKSIIELDEGTILIGTTRGLYTFDGSTFRDWNGEERDDVIRNNINTMVRTENKIVIGTILNGLYIYDLQYNLLKVINTDNQLQNNTVLTLFADPYDNVWVGLDKGLSYIAFDTPIHSYLNEYTDMGSVYAAALFDNELYIGTNQGLFWYKRDANGSFYDRQLITGSQGQVWFIKEIEGNLYAGLNEGTFVIENKQLRQVSPVFGGYNLKSYSANNKNLLLQSSYSVLVNYSLQEGIYQQNVTLSGFSAPARYMEFDHLGNIWLGHSVKGVFQLQPNIQFDKIESVRRITEAEGLPLTTNRVFKLDNRIMSSNQDSLYEWDSINERFVPYTDLDPYFTETGTVTNVQPVGDQKYWVIKNDELNLFEIHFNTVKLLYRVLPHMYNFNLVENYENVIPLTESLHLICLDDGFALLNLNLANQSKYPRPELSLNNVEVLDAMSNETENIRKADESLEFDYTDNTLRVNWSTTQVAGNRAFFQYRLSGINENWSPWTTQNSHVFERLPSGDYGLQIRTVAINGLLVQSPVYQITIKKPWYLSSGAFVLYVFFIGSSIAAIRLFISRRRWKITSQELEQQHKQMLLDREKSEKEIIKLKNDKLQTEIEHKSSQLASNTMAIMRKNNLLSSIKEELEKQKKELGDKLPNRYFNQINKLIESGIEDEHEWEVFEQLYDQTHGDFFKRLKEAYPNLTPSDLRLCAYLRMNLASKEIAPLLNISVRGVEERRYRLRKRLNLTTNTNLNELIMTF